MNALHNNTMGNGPRYQALVLYRLVCLLVLSMSLSACSRTIKYLELAKQSTVQMHSEFNSRQYEAIYQSADASLRQSASEAEFSTFLEAVQQRLGKVKEPVLKSQRISFHPGGRATIILTYDTSFEHGSGTEHLIWDLDEDRIALSRYSIDSKTLLSK